MKNINIKSTDEGAKSLFDFLSMFNLDLISQAKVRAICAIIYIHRLPFRLCISISLC